MALWGFLLLDKLLEACQQEDLRIDILPKTRPGKKDFYTTSLTNIYESKTIIKIKLFT
jgi:hypothetical protein